MYVDRSCMMSSEERLDLGGRCMFSLKIQMMFSGFHCFVVLLDNNSSPFVLLELFHLLLILSVSLLSLDFLVLVLYEPCFVILHSNYSLLLQNTHQFTLTQLYHLLLRYENYTDNQSISLTLVFLVIELSHFYPPDQRLLFFQPLLFLFLQLLQFLQQHLFLMCRLAQCVIFVHQVMKSLFM